MILGVIAIVSWSIPLFLDGASVPGISKRHSTKPWYMPGGLLTGTSWHIKEVKGGGADYSAGSFPVTFGSGKMQGTICNVFSGPYTFNGLSVKTEAIASTKRACIGKGIDKAEQAFFTALSHGAQYAIIGNTLELVDQEDGIRIKLIRP